MWQVNCLFLIITWNHQFENVSAARLNAKFYRINCCDALPYVWKACIRWWHDAIDRQTISIKQLSRPWESCTCRCHVAKPLSSLSFSLSVERKRHMAYMMESRRIQVVCCYCPVFALRRFEQAITRRGPHADPIPFFTSEGRVVNERGWRISGACHAIRAWE